MVFTLQHEIMFAVRKTYICEGINT